jgi:hypothetical protein
MGDFDIAESRADFQVNLGAGAFITIGLLAEMIGNTGGGPAEEINFSESCRSIGSDFNSRRDKYGYIAESGRQYNTIYSRLKMCTIQSYKCVAEYGGTFYTVNFHISGVNPHIFEGPAKMLPDDIARMRATGI